MTTVFAAVLGLMAAGLVVPPLLRREAADPDDAPARDLVLERERVFGALRELEYDRAMGKVDYEDYAALQRVFTRKAVALLKAEESILKDLDDALEAEIAWERAQLRGHPGAAGAETAGGTWSDAAPSGLTRFCSQCGARLVTPGQRFCHQCGAPTGKGVAPVEP